MTIHAILVHAEADPACEARLTLAADLANQFQAVLIGAAAEAYEPQSFASGYADVDGELLIAEASAVEDDLKIAENRFIQASAGVAAGTQWRAASAVPEQFIAEESRAADLLVVGPRQREPFGFQNRLDPGDILMRAGRPVLIAPLELKALDISSVVVAWKDTRECRRAVVDALPFLKGANQVLVAAVSDPQDQETARIGVADVAEFLARHGVKASTAVRERNPISDADTLIDMVEMQEAGLIVAGGFGHARFREWVFGGVTQELLWYGRKPVLLSH
jgi:nucleotide-binding universal stress UspA family protein